MNGKNIAIFTISILLISISMSVVGANASSTYSSNYTSRDVIRINGNAEFNPLHGVTGGSGTLDDPWIISGWEIDVHGNAQDAIYIGNTTDYFVIEKCYLHNTSSASSTYNLGAGIHLYRVSNGIVRDNIVSEIDSDGIDLGGVSFTSVEYNTVQNTRSTGIGLGNSHNNTLQGNVVRNTNVGMMLSASHNNTIEDNIITQPKYNGLIIYASSRDNFVANNTMAFSSNQDGIYLYWGVNNNTIMGNFLYNNKEYGVKISDNFEKSTDNLIVKNLFYYNNNSGDYYDSDTVQAWDEATNNHWYEINAGYGNYWREWANNNNTNDQNGDGIVDWIYRIDGPSGKTDKYPLKYSIPTPPQNLVAQSGSGYVNLTWDAPVGDGGKAITAYKIYRNGTLIATVPQSQLYYNDTDVVGEHPYRYYVVAVNEIGDGLKSNFVRTTPETVIPELTPLIVVFLVSIALIVIYKKK